MAEPALTQPSEIYRPFTPAETEVLRGFAANVRRLAAMSFFEKVPREVTVTLDADGVASRMEEPDDEAVHAAISRFRHVYIAHEPHSLSNAMKVLKRSVHDRGSGLRDQALAELNGHLEAARRAEAAGIGMGLVLEKGDAHERITPARIIDAYAHGEYLHSGNEKSELARNLDELGVPRLTLYSVMLRLRNVYWSAANAVDRALTVES